jgi:hypothetical protein
MKTKLTCAVMVMVLFLAAGATAWSQATAGKVQGTITDGGKPVPNAQVMLTNAATGHNIKLTSDKNGQVIGVGVPFGDYNEEVTAGDKHYKKMVRIAGQRLGNSRTHSDQIDRNEPESLGLPTGLGQCAVW